MSVHDFVSLLILPIAFVASVYIKSESDPQNLSSNNWIIGPVIDSESGNLLEIWYMWGPWSILVCSVQLSQHCAVIQSLLCLHWCYGAGINQGREILEMLQKLNFFSRLPSLLNGSCFCENKNSGSCRHCFLGAGCIEKQGRTVHASHKPAETCCAKGQWWLSSMRSEAVLLTDWM